MSWKRVVDWIIWGLYLAAILLCAYVTAYAAVTGRTLYIWLGAVGWVASMAWGLFFRFYVMSPRGKRRKPRTGTGGEFKWHPTWGWHLESFRRGGDI